MDLDWAKLFIPELPLLEIFLRGTAVYLFLFAYFRLLRRSGGGLGVADVLVVVLVADAAQSALSGEDHSITAGLLTVAVIALWDFAIDWISYHVPGFERLAHPEPLLLVRNGELQRKALARHMITTEELKSQLRQAGVEDVSEVKEVYLEGDGQVSVLKKDPGGNEPARKKRTTPG